MITRIPQPQFIGPAPSEVVTQAGDNGTRLAQMFSTAMQEGTKNYLTQKQLDIEKQKAEASAQYNQEIAANRKSVEQDARDRAIREDFQKELDKAGPGAEWRVFIDNKPMAMKFFGTFAEDPEHAKSLYDAGLKTAMGHGTATSFFGAGAVGLGQQGTPPQGAQAAPTAPVSPTTTPAVPPGAPPLTPPSPPPMVQGANPQGSPTARVLLHHCSHLNREVFRLRSQRSRRDCRIMQQQRRQTQGLQKLQRMQQDRLEQRRLSHRRKRRQLQWRISPMFR